VNNGAGASLVPIVRGGPQTQKGKEVARWNATRHGISSPSPVVPGLETQEDWQEYREAIMAHYSPSGPVMCELAERVALLTWRLRRVTRYEAQSIAILQVLKAEAAGAIVFGVYIEAKKRLGGELDWEALALPGISEDDDIYELPTMSVEDVRGCIEVLASAASVDPDELLAAAADEAGYEARRAAGKKERMEEDISRKERERILPDADTMQKIARYEAHLSRQLYQALHALEVLRAT
jgi:hypothetical protein